MQFIKTVVSWLVWPVFIAAFLVAFAISGALHLDPGLSLFAITVTHLAAIAALEVVMPARTDWDWRKDGEVINDLIHGALLEAGARMGAAALTITMTAAAARLSAQAPWALWPTAWPLWTQVVLAAVIYDFVDYWKHRAYHAWAWAWPIHALHHNPKRMHVFKAGRLHFLEAAIRAAITSAPLVLLGAPPAVLFWIAALANALGDTNHWNVRSRVPGFLDAIVATPNAHWLHHARDVAAGSANYSTFTLLFDHVFGTFRRQPRGAIEDVGIAFDPVPRNALGQILAPFAWPWLAARARRAPVQPNPVRRTS